MTRSLLLALSWAFLTRLSCAGKHFPDSLESLQLDKQVDAFIALETEEEQTDLQNLLERQLVEEETMGKFEKCNNRNRICAPGLECTRTTLAAPSRCLPLACLTKTFQQEECQMNCDTLKATVFAKAGTTESGFKDHLLQHPGVSRSEMTKLPLFQQVVQKFARQQRHF